MIIWIKFVIATLYVLTSKNVNADNILPPICSDCTCNKINETSIYVKCIRPFQNMPITITNDDFWINSSTNETYPYTRVSYNYFNIRNLNYTFPTSSLTYLNLSYNGIVTLGDSIFKNLENMEVLDLSFNDIEMISPSAFKGLYLEGSFTPLRSLKQLRLSHNKLHTLNIDVFEHTTDIEILDLSFNPLGVIDAHTVIAINELAYLKELYLRNTNLKTLPDNMMHTNKYLHVLDLSGNPIDTVPTTLYESKSLSTLDLNGTNFVNLTEENGFTRVLPNLTTLYMCHSGLQRIEKGSMSGLINLEELHIHNTDLEKFDSFAMVKVNENGAAIWPPITKLYIQNNKLSYIDLDLLARWDNLKDLDIDNNVWTCECENQWLVDELIPLYLKINEEKAKRVMCGAPIEMERKSLYELYIKQYKMRCLDDYGARPENDAIMLVGVLAGVLIAIPAILLILLAYQRKWLGGIFSWWDNSPASYSRRFYSTTSSNDEYM